MFLFHFLEEIPLNLISLCLQVNLTIDGRHEIDIKRFVRIEKVCVIIFPVFFFRKYNWSVSVDLLSCRFLEEKSKTLMS